MNPTRIVFFGSFLEYSVTILKALHQSTQFEVVAVVSTPTKPAGRKKQLKPTAVSEFALQENLPLLTPETLDDQTLKQLNDLTSQPPDFVVVAGYGKLLPPSWLSWAKLAPVNVHFSLLPKYRGAMPGEWAILLGEAHTGVSLIEMSDKIDQGKLICQEQIDIFETDTRVTLYDKLYQLGAKLTVETLPLLASWHQEPDKPINQTHSGTKLWLPPQPQPTLLKPYARLITKNDSFVDWSLIQLAIKGKDLPQPNRPKLFQLVPNPWSQAVEQAVRALYGWPGVWTIVKTPKGDKRLKLHSARINQGKLELKQVQLEGEQPKDYRAQPAW